MKKHFFSYFVPALTLTGLTIGGLVYFIGYKNIGQQIWMATLIIGTVPLALRMARDIFKGKFGIDIIAIVAIGTSFFLSQYLAGTVILLMLSGGEALEEYALNRSSRELTKLLSMAPTMGHLKINGEIKEIAAELIQINDILLVKPGETVPVDGLVLSGSSETDESSITGESMLAEKNIGSLVFSGSVNQGAALEIRAEKPAAESQYQRIVKLVKDAQESRAPLVRLADRYAVWFTGLTFIVSGAAWLASGQALRFLEVLVVATPCPLILATPIAIISGISKSASRGIIVKNGGALEKLGEAKAIIFDKTGTLTLGEPKVLENISLTPNKNSDDILYLAASLDQLSVHVLANSLVSTARKTLTKVLAIPQNLKETLGSGVEGTVDGSNYIFGKLSFLKIKGVKVPEQETARHEKLESEEKIAVYLAQGELLLGCVVFADVVRPEIEHVFREMVKHKIQKIYMLTGDKHAVAEKIAGQLGITDFKAEMLPEQKVLEVHRIRSEFSPAAMVGDGVNDAPALAAADVGIALAFHGSSASSESADIVIMQNSLMRVHDAVHIAQNVMRIAKQSIFVGLGLSIILMLIASFGYITPVYGAMLQEAIDVAVILNALRVNFDKIS